MLQYTVILVSSIIDNVILVSRIVSALDI
jgi:hypothetical protein